MITTATAKITAPGSMLIAVVVTPSPVRDLNG
jgi:hypothetical protein